MKRDEMVGGGCECEWIRRKVFCFEWVVIFAMLWFLWAGHPSVSGDLMALLHMHMGRSYVVFLLSFGRLYAIV